jgi:RND family efflux transporter MFP subunit
MSHRHFALICSLFVLAHSCSFLRSAEAVSVVQPLEREANVYELEGRIEPAEVVAIRAPVGGVVAKIHVREGADVKQGDLLFEIAVGSIEAEANKAADAVRRGDETLRRLDASLAEARKNTSDKKRFDLEKLAAEREVAAAQLAIVQAESKRLQSEAERRRVKAPLSGRFSKPLVAVGGAVDAGPRSATLLGTIVRTDSMRVTFELDESGLLRLRQRKQEEKVTAFLGLPGEMGYPHRGTLAFIDNRIDPKSRLVRCRALFPSSGTLNAALLASPDAARLRLVIGAPRKRLLVPGRALAIDAEGNHYVLVVNSKNIVEQRRVKLEGQVDGLQVIADGLQPNSWIIIGAERNKGKPADQNLSSDDFVSDVLLLSVKPGTKVIPIRTTLK